MAPSSRLLAMVILVVTTCILTAANVSAEVCFGKNVRIGGHHVTGQTFNNKRRSKFYIYSKQPQRAGCTWK